MSCWPSFWNTLGLLALTMSVFTILSNARKLRQRVAEIEGVLALTWDKVDALQHAPSCAYRQCRLAQPCAGHSLGACCPCTCPKGES